MKRQTNAKHLRAIVRDSGYQAGPTLRSGPSKEQTHLLTPKFWLLSSDPINFKIWLKLACHLSFLWSDSWILICHPVLFAPFSLFSLESLTCPWPDANSSAQILPYKEPEPLTRCLYTTTSVVIATGGFLFSSGVSTSLEWILQA